jgi:AraC-like DNA-binding protein
MLFSWFELLLIVGVIQGVITSILLFKESSYLVQNKLMAITILCFSAICIKMAVNSMGLGVTYEWLSYIPLAFETVIPPLLFLYGSSLSDTRFKLSSKKLIHFLPFTFFMIYAVFIYFNVLLLETNDAKESFLTLYHHSLIKTLEDYLTVASILAYIAIGSIVLKKYRQKIDDLTSDNSHAVFSWLRSIMILMVILLIFLITNMLLDGLFSIESKSILHWKVYFLYLAVVVYYLGFKAYKSPIHFSISSDDSEVNDETVSQGKIPNLKAQKLATDIENIIDQKRLYLNPTFNIQDLSQILQVNQRSVSQAINEYLKVSFRELINKKRIEMAKDLLTANSGNSILSQALECGFNSEASFYRIFKKHIGKSPTQFIESIKTSSIDT